MFVERRQGWSTCQRARPISSEQNRFRWNLLLERNFWGLLEGQDQEILFLKWRILILRTGGFERDEINSSYWI